MADGPELMAGMYHRTTSDQAAPKRDDFAGAAKAAARQRLVGELPQDRRGEYSLLVAATYATACDLYSSPRREVSPLPGVRR